MEIRRIQKIQSVNFGGKVNRTVQKMEDKWKNYWGNKVEKSKNFWKKTGDYVFDKMDKQQAQNFLSQLYPVEIKLGKIKKVDNYNGGMYKFLAGLPEDKSYECGYIFRNGNDIRLYDKTKHFVAENPDDPQNIKIIQRDALEWFDSEDDESVKKFC